MTLAEAVAVSADPARARHFHDAFQTAGVDGPWLVAEGEPARVLAAVWSGSQVLGDWLVQHPDWLPMLLDIEGLQSPRTVRALQTELGAWLPAALRSGDFTGALARVRELQRRELLRIAARDLARLGRTAEIMLELSDLADTCLQAVFRVVWAQLTARFGAPWEQTIEGGWQPSRSCVLGMGKLGGQELNYSSDVDVLFVYSDEGWVFKDAPRKGSTAGKGLTNHEFFRRFGEAFIAEVGRSTAEGMLYRIDLRLRPEGKAGPLARSLESYENYYAQWGQTWERLMLIKTRVVAGDAALADEFLEMVQPFRFPRLIGSGVMEEIAAMKRRLETEIVRASDEDRNVKLWFPLPG